MIISRLVTTMAVLAGCCLLSLAESKAIPPDTLEHYRIVPRFSKLQQTGGFAGIDVEYPLRGEYDFLREWRGGDPSSGLWLTARFDNADIRAPLGDLLPAFIDVDELLNLEGLRGELLPLGAPFDVFRFRGFINDTDATSPLENSSIELFAAKIGPWMYLYGETTPPPGSADFFEYELRALARTRPWADMNDDGVVDAADYTMSRDHDPALLVDWREQYGEIAPDMAAMDAMVSAARSSATSIPEPATLLIALLALTPGLRTRRSGCRP